MSYYSAINSPFPTYTTAVGAANNGTIYIGLVGLDPEANPQAVYWDAAGASPASQPLVLSGGYVINSNSPAQPHTRFPCSIRVYDSLGNVVFYQPNYTDLDSSFAAGVAVYGATGDGSTDDQAALNTALAAGVGLMPDGTYCISQTLNFGDGSSSAPSTINNIIMQSLTGLAGLANQEVLGGKTGAVRLKWIGASGGTMVKFNGPGTFSLKNIELDGNNLAGVGLECSHAIGGEVDIVVRNVKTSYIKFSAFENPTNCYTSSGAGMRVKLRGYDPVAGSNFIGLDVGNSTYSATGAGLDVARVHFEMLELSRPAGASNACIGLRMCDNVTFGQVWCYGASTTVGYALAVIPPTGHALAPFSPTAIGIADFRYAGVVGLMSGTWTPNSAGDRGRGIFISRLSEGDNAEVLPAHPAISGYTYSGMPFGSAAGTVSLKHFGAACDSGTTDDSAAFTRAVASGAKRIYVPNGTTIDTAAALTITGATGVHFVGDGVQASVITVKGTSGNVVTFSGCQDTGFVDVGFIYAAEPTSGFVLKFTDGCFEPIAKVRFDYHFEGIHMEDGSEPRFDVVSRYGLGAYIGVKFGGTSGKAVYGATLTYHGDTPPATAVTTFKTYGALTAFTLGQVTTANSKVFICTQGGTTGAASSPSTTSGYRGLTDITDGTVKWRYLCRIDSAHIVQDSNAYSIRIGKSFALNGAYSFRMLDTLATGSSYPMWAYLGLESDHAVLAGIWLNAGEGVYINDNAWVGSCLNGNGIQAINNFRGEMQIDPTVRVVGNGQHGLLIGAGKTYDIQGVYSGNSQTSSGTYHGISIVNSVTNFIVRATCGYAASYSSTQAYGVSLGASTDNFIIDGNMQGNVTGGATGPLAGATKVYRNI